MINIGENMKIKKIDYEFSVCKVKDYSEVSPDSEYCFIGKTDEEKSLVCMSDSIPDHVIACDKGWKGFRIDGILDFSLIGILSKLSALLAAQGIGIFVVSTYNTDYIFVKKENYDKALDVLKANGYSVN